MKKQVIFLSAFFLIHPVLFADVKPVEVIRIGISFNKTTVLTFQDKVDEIILGNSEYAFKKKGKNILIHAKSSRALPATLFVTFGEKKASFTAEVFPDSSASINQFIHLSERDSQEILKPFDKINEEQASIKLISTEQIEKILPTNKAQKYFGLGAQGDGIKVVVPDVVRDQGNIYIKIYVENNTNTDLNLATYSFEYVTYTWKYWLFRSKKTQNSTPVTAPVEMIVAPKSKKSFIFALPAFVSNGGVDIFLAEDPRMGQREFKFSIPNKILIYAERR